MTTLATTASTLLVELFGRWIRNPNNRIQLTPEMATPAFRDVLFRNRLAPWLGALAEPVDATNEPIQQLLHDAQASYKRNLLNAAQKLQAIQRLTETFEQAKIPMLLMRGVSSAHRYYGDIGMRMCEDVDVLIPFAYRPDALAVLTASNYLFPERQPPDWYLKRHALHWEITEPDNGVKLEVHWRLDHPFTLYRFDETGIFERAKAAQTDGVKWLQPGPIDDLLISCAHVRRHCMSLDCGPLQCEADAEQVIELGLLYWWLDIALMLSRVTDDVTPEIILDRADRQRLVSCLYASLQSCEQLWSTRSTRQLLSAIRERYPDLETMSKAANWQNVRIDRPPHPSGINYRAYLWPPAWFFNSPGTQSRTIHTAKATAKLAWHALSSLSCRCCKSRGLGASAPHPTASQTLNTKCGVP